MAIRKCKQTTLLFAYGRSIERDLASELEGETAAAARDVRSTNCGSCHNEESSIANLGLLLKAPHPRTDEIAAPLVADAPLGTLTRRARTWRGTCAVGVR